MFIAYKEMYVFAARVNENIGKSGLQEARVDDFSPRSFFRFSVSMSLRFK
jgi:hypothetical protein